MKKRRWMDGVRERKDILEGQARFYIMTGLVCLL